MFLHIILYSMIHENIYHNFYYEGCFQYSIKKYYSASVPYFQNSEIWQVTAALIY